jgi:hypothetical protein
MPGSVSGGLARRLQPPEATRLTCKRHAGWVCCEKGRGRSALEASRTACRRGRITSVCKLRKLTAPNAGQIGRGGSPRSRFSTYPWSSFAGRVKGPNSTSQPGLVSGGQATRHRSTLPLPLMTLRSGLLSVWQNSRRVLSIASLTSATTQSAMHVSAYPVEPTLREGSNPSSGTTSVTGTFPPSFRYTARTP